MNRINRIVVFFSLIYIDDDYDITHEECTVELRASIGDQIRLVFYSIDKNISDDYDKDYIMSIPNFPCLRIRDVC
jgi:hypothetical protein